MLTLETHKRPYEFRSGSRSETKGRSKSVLLTQLYHCKLEKVLLAITFFVKAATCRGLSEISATGTDTHTIVRRRESVLTQ